MSAHPNTWKRSVQSWDAICAFDYTLNEAAVFARILDVLHLDYEWCPMPTSDTVRARLRVFPAIDRDQHPDHRSYVLNDATPADTLAHLRLLKMQADNLISQRENPPEYLGRHIRRKML